jgi:hypothetical protein
MTIFDFASTSAPFASSASTTSEWPFFEARWSGVHPSCGAGEQIAVSTFLRHSPDPLQPARTITRCFSRSGPTLPPSIPRPQRARAPPPPRETAYFAPYIP